MNEIMTNLHQQILRTILYYEIFAHPLTSDEIFLFLPQNSITESDLEKVLQDEANNSLLRHHNDQFFLLGRNPGIVELRRKKERLARKRWRIAKMMCHIIKRFPFVRGIFVSGDLAKNVANRESDIDYVIITAPGRLWICRTLLILFKKIILLNKKKYFCLNYFVTSNHLEAKDKNYFTATEIAHLKPLYNFPIFLNFLNANVWIKKFFPNYFLFRNHVRECNSSSSALQKFFELPFASPWADKLDQWLMKKMGEIWKQRYPHLNDDEREFRFRCSPDESRAFGQEWGSKILATYHEKLQQFGLQAPLIYD